jgi:single-strand DNA-binding protein
MDYHLTVIKGRIGGDPEVRNSSKGESYVTFPVAVNTGYGDQSFTTWYNCKIFGKSATNAAKLINSKVMTKGSPIFIEGKMTFRTHTASNGEKKNYSDLVVRFFDVTKKNTNSGMTDENEINEDKNEDNVLDEISEEDLPF